MNGAVLASDGSNVPLLPPGAGGEGRPDRRAASRAAPAPAAASGTSSTSSVMTGAVQLPVASWIAPSASGPAAAST